MKIDWIKKAEDAEKRIRGYIRVTPVELSYSLSQVGNCHVYLKLENYQITGSFKIRGAANMLLSLSGEEKEKGVIAASSGNHGAAVAHMLHTTSIKGAIFLPNNANGAKISALRAYDVRLESFGTDVCETEMYARETAQKKDRVFIPPYNHPKIIAGQATVGLELQKQLSSIDVVFVPIGGGGLASGVAGYLKLSDKSIEIIGCQPENSAVMHESVKAGRIVEMESKSTIADGTAGGIESDSLTFECCRQYVDDFVLVSEDEIKDAILLMLEKHSILVEGAAALSIAAFIKIRKRYENRNVILIISGKRISVDTLRYVLNNGSDRLINRE